MQIRNYENNEGQRRRVAEVVANNVRFLEYSDDAPGNSGNSEPENDDIDVPF